MNFKIAGRFRVSIMTLQAPPPQYMCRTISPSWVQTIKDRLRAMPTPHLTIFPCLVDQNDIPDAGEFDQENMANYTIFTLGGNHLRTATQELLKENDTTHLDALRHVEIELYAGLDKGQARRLGNRHNIQCETSQPTFFDQVCQARRLLHEMSGTPDGTELSQSYPQGYKAAFLVEIARDDVVCIAL